MLAPALLVYISFKTPELQVNDSASEVDPGELEDRTRENGVGRHHERLDASVGCNHSGENEHADDNVD